MQDTPEHIKQIKLKLSLAKPPGERLLKFIQDNDVMYKALLQTKASLASEKDSGKAIAEVGLKTK